MTHKEYCKEYYLKTREIRLAKCKERYKNKKEGISLIELLSASAIVVVAVLGFWKNTDVRLSRLELITEQQNKDREIINAKLDKLQESVNTINLSLINKQDRK